MKKICLILLISVLIISCNKPNESSAFLSNFTTINEFPTSESIYKDEFFKRLLANKIVEIEKRELASKFLVPVNEIGYEYLCHSKFKINSRYYAVTYHVRASALWGGDYYLCTYDSIKDRITSKLLMKGLDVQSKYENDTLFIDTGVYDMDYDKEEDRHYIIHRKYVFKDSIMMDVKYISSNKEKYYIRPKEYAKDSTMNITPAKAR